MKYRVDKQRLSALNPAGVISFGAENASFFYQAEEWCSGRDIYYIDTQHLTRHTCMFLLSCLQKITLMYSYNYGLFPDLLKQETVRLPITSKGTPDWGYMDNYMRNVELKANKLMNFVGEMSIEDS